MDSLIGYGSEDEVEERYGNHYASGGGGYGGHGGSSRRRDDDTNYDDVNMDMSEDSQGAESEPELPQAEPAPSRYNYKEEKKYSESRDRDDSRRRRDTPPKYKHERERDRRSPRRDDRFRGEKPDSRGQEAGARRGLLGDRPAARPAALPARPAAPPARPAAPHADKPPALMDLKFVDKSHDARDAVSPRFAERDRRDRERERDRDRDHRTGRHSEEKRSSHKYSSDRRERSRSRGAPTTSSSHSSSSSSDRRSPSDYRPSYKVNKKLEVMEKMGLQIKTPDGSMATAQQLRAAASDAVPQGRPTYFNQGAMSSHRILDQVQKRKLLWSNKAKNETEEAAKWSGTRFAQDNDGKQVSKFMRLMGIKEPAAVKPEPVPETADPIKKQEELFQAMQAQYEVARATTHTMRGVGLGFQRGQF